MKRGRPPQTRESVVASILSPFGGSFPDECISSGWKLDRYGYAKFVVAGRHCKVHRLVLEAVTGTTGEYACHTCDNRACCNPRHLYWGTAKSNAADREIRKRSRYRRMDAVDRRLALILAKRGCRPRLIAEACCCSVKHATTIVREVRNV